MKTAVEQLIEKLRESGVVNEEFIQAVLVDYIRIEKEQIIDAFGNGEYMVFIKKRPDYDHDDYNFNDSDEFYNHTYCRPERTLNPIIELDYE